MEIEFLSELFDDRNIVQTYNIDPRYAVALCQRDRICDRFARSILVFIRSILDASNTNGIYFLLANKDDCSGWKPQLFFARVLPFLCHVFPVV